MEFPRQEFQNGLLFPSPGDLPDSGIKSGSTTLQADFLPLSHQGSPRWPTAEEKRREKIENNGRHLLSMLISSWVWIFFFFFFFFFCHPAPVYLPAGLEDNFCIYAFQCFCLLNIPLQWYIACAHYNCQLLMKSDMWLNWIYFLRTHMLTQNQNLPFPFPHL